MCPPTISQVAAIAAIDKGELDARRMVDEYERRRRVICSGFKDIGLELSEPKGAFYVFPSIQKTGLSSEEFAENLIIKSKVAVVPGNAFGPSGEGFVRCSYATSLETIYEALNRIDDFLSHIKPRKAGSQS